MWPHRGWGIQGMDVGHIQGNVGDMEDVQGEIQ